MTTLRQVIQYIVERRPGATDRQLTEAIYGADQRHQQVNQECRACAEIERRQDSLYIGNYIRAGLSVPKRNIADNVVDMRPEIGPLDYPSG
jgi:hypothetical protein